MIKKIFIAGIIFLTPAVVASEKIILKTEFQDIPPKLIVEKDGTLSGISYELMKMIERSKDIGFVYNTTPVPLIRASKDIENGDMDIQIGIQKTPERETKMIFGEPLYKVKTVALVRIDDNAKFKTLREIGGLGPEKGLIITVWGTGIAELLNRLEYLYVDDGAKSAEIGLRKLVERKGRVFIYHNLSTFYIIEMPGIKGKVRTIDLDFDDNSLLENTYQYVAFSRKVKQSVINRVNAIIRDKRKTGELDRITSKYLK